MKLQRIHNPARHDSELPSAAWRSFGEYRDAMLGTTEASDVAHLTTCLAAAGANLGRNVWMFDGRLVYANGFYVFAGETGDKKTTAQRRARLLLDPSVQVIQGDGSVQGTCDGLVSTSEEPLRVVFLHEEIASIFSNRQSMRNSMLTFVTKAFDCPETFQLHYRKHPIQLHKPTPTIYGCSTAAWLARHIRDDDFHGGVMNRFLMLSGRRKDPIPCPASPHLETVAAISSRFVALAKLQYGELHFSKAAAQLYHDFYVAFARQEREDLLNAGLERLPLYARKIAMIHACFEGTAPEVTFDQLEASLMVVDYAACCMESFLAYRQKYVSPQEHLEAWFLNWLAHPSHDGRPKRYIHMTTAKKFGGARLFNAVMDNLARAGRIEITGNPPRVHLVK